MFFKTKICKNKLHIYPEVEVHVAKQSPTELIELGCLVPDTSLYFEYCVYPSEDILRGKEWWQQTNRGTEMIFAHILKRNIIL